MEELWQSAGPMAGSHWLATWPHEITDQLWEDYEAFCAGVSGTKTRFAAPTSVLVASSAMFYALLYAIIRRVLRLSGISPNAEAEVLVLRHELAVLRRQVKRPKLHGRDKLFLPTMSRMLPWERWAGQFSPGGQNRVALSGP